MRISDWSSDVCSSDLGAASTAEPSDLCIVAAGSLRGLPIPKSAGPLAVVVTAEDVSIAAEPLDMLGAASVVVSDSLWTLSQLDAIYRLPSAVIVLPEHDEADRSEEHTPELQTTPP